MNARADNRSRVFINPAEMHVTDVPTQIVTCVGSCLAITLFARRLGLGGLCHAVHDAPARPVGGDEVGRYVSTSVTYMLEMFRSIGAETDEIEVKAFGGARILGTTDGNDWKGVGAGNIRMFRHIANRDGLRVVASDMGGETGRRVVFDTGTGDVFMKRLHPTRQAR